MHFVVNYLFCQVDYLPVFREDEHSMIAQYCQSLHGTNSTHAVNIFKVLTFTILSLWNKTVMLEQGDGSQAENRRRDSASVINLFMMHKATDTVVIILKLKEMKEISWC